MEPSLKGKLRSDKVMKIVPTDGGVSHERLLILQHGVNGDFLAVLRCDDGDGRLFVGRDGWHLFDNFNLCVLVMDSGE